MPSSTSMGGIVIRIRGDASGYFDVLKDVENQTMAVVAAMNAATSAATAAALSFATNEFRKFNKALTESLSIMGLTADEEKQIEKASLSLGRTALHGPTDLAKAFYFMASAGMDAQQSIAALPAIEKFATAGNFDLAAATTYAADAQASMGMKSKNAATNMKSLVRITDVLVKADTLANASVLQFSRALTRQAGGALKAFGKDVEEGVAVLAAMADQGVKAQLAGTHLSMIIRHLTKNAIKNENAFKRYGIAVFDNAGEMRNFADIIEDMENAFGPMNDELRSAAFLQLGFEARMQQSIMPLLGTSDAIRRYEKELRNAGGMTEKVANKQMTSFHNQLQIIWNNVVAFGIDIGREVVPIMLALGFTLKFALGVWADLPPVVKKTTAAVLMGVVAFTTFAAVVFTAGMIFNKMFGGIGIILGVIVTGVAAMAGAFAGIGYSAADSLGVFDDMQKQFTSFWKSTEPVRLALVSLISLIWDMGGAILSSLGKDAMGAIKGIAGVTLTVQDAMFMLAASINAVEFAILHIREIWDVLATFVLFKLEEAKNAVIHVFTAVIPTTFKNSIKIMKQLWGSLFDWAQGFLTTFAENFKNIFSNIGDIITGKKKIGDLLQQAPKFQWNIRDLDPIPEREMGELEKKLHDQFMGMAEDLNDDLNKFLGMKIDMQFAKNTLPHLDDANDKTKEWRDNMADVVKETQRFDAALTGSAEAFTRIMEFSDRLKFDAIAKETRDRTKVQRAGNLPAHIPALGPIGGAKKVALEPNAGMGGGLEGNNIAGLLARIAQATEEQARRPGLRLDAAGLT